jgi:cation:H+ antiporter
MVPPTGSRLHRSEPVYAADDALPTIHGGPSVLIPLIAVVVGLVVLTLAADWFVEGAARLALALRLSTVVVGAVVIGFGTSAPEFVVSILAAAQGSLDIAVGNVIGSNIANLTLVLGVAAIITPIAVSSPTLRREVPLSTGAVIVFAALLVPGRGLGNIEGIVLATGLLAVTVVLVRGARDPVDVLGSEAAAYFDRDVRQIVVSREAARTLVGLVGTLAGAWAVVHGAREIAEIAGLAEGFVGLTLVAVGTSLPELVTSIQAARRREADLIVGNLLGSNIMNSLLVGGFTGIIGADRLADPALAILPNAAMVGVAVLAAVLMLTGRRVDRWEGALLFAGFLVLIPFLPR